MNIRLYLLVVFYIGRGSNAPKLDVRVDRGEEDLETKNLGGDELLEARSRTRDFCVMKFFKVGFDWKGSGAGALLGHAGRVS